MMEPTIPPPIPMATKMMIEVTSNMRTSIIMETDSVLNCAIPSTCQFFDEY
jgi:hypothetical protein